MVRPAGYSRLCSSPTETFEEALKSRRTVAEGQENNLGTPQGCSRGGDRLIKFSQSLNSVIGLATSSQKAVCRLDKPLM
jgi:hypothetical protein